MDQALGGMGEKKMTALQVARHWEEQECVELMEVRAKEHGRLPRGIGAFSGQLIL